MVWLPTVKEFWRYD